MPNADVLFLFKSGRKARLSEKGPREFFYGFTELDKQGLSAQILEEDELPPVPLGGWIERLATRIASPAFGLNVGALARLSSGPALERLRAASVIVAATNAQGLALGALKSFGALHDVPVLFLPMGALPRRTGPIRSFFLKKWMSCLDLAPISRSEADWLARNLPHASSLAYLPFGVDTAFWTPAAEARTKDFAFSIGNDPHRDWACLAQAWRPSLPRLKLVTRRVVPPSQGEIDVLAGDWNSRAFSDAQIREFYQSAQYVVLPLRNTTQPSGQSACLQAMACGKAVILSAIDGLWDDELLRDEETCLLVPPGDPHALGNAAERLSKDPALAARLGANARRIVTARFSIERMGLEMAGRLSILLSTRTKQRG